MKQLPTAKPPFSPDEVQIKITDRGCLIEVPLEDNEQIYGFGLQFETFGQRGLAQAPDSKRQSAERTRIYTCSADILRLYQRVRYSGQHGTVYHFPMRLQSENRSIVVNYKRKKENTLLPPQKTCIRTEGNGNKVHIDVPGAKGIEVFIITGPEVLDVVKRYNLLSGGGCLPPMWGLGFKYRVKGDATQDSVMRFANYFREKQIPCDVLGLEPGWQTATYSCSYRWSDDRFPRHKEMLDQLQQKGYKVNLWEHAYVHPSSPIRRRWSPTQAISLYGTDWYRTSSSRKHTKYLPITTAH